MLDEFQAISRHLYADFSLCCAVGQIWIRSINAKTKNLSTFCVTLCLNNFCHFVGTHNEKRNLHKTKLTSYTVIGFNLNCWIHRPKSTSQFDFYLYLGLSLFLPSTISVIVRFTLQKVLSAWICWLEIFLCHISRLYIVNLNELDHEMHLLGSANWFGISFEMVLLKHNIVNMNWFRYFDPFAQNYRQ